MGFPALIEESHLATWLRESPLTSRGYGARLIAGLVGILVVGALGRSGVAHHSFAMYDTTTSKTLTGKLVRFVPGPNHAQLIFELLGADGRPVLDGDGKPVVWAWKRGATSAP